MVRPQSDLAPVNDDSLIASVDELVDTFRSALVALVPLAERSKLTWADEDQHPDWERLAACLFDAFVGGPVNADRDRVDGELELAPYDIDLDDYSRVSWVSVRTVSGGDLALVRLLSWNGPFDTVQGVEVDPVTLAAGVRHCVPLAGLRFGYVRRTPDGQSIGVHEVEAVG